MSETSQDSESTPVTPPQSLLELLSLLDIRGVPPRLSKPGDVIHVSLQPPIQAIYELGGDQVLSAFKLKLGELALNEQIRTIGLDLGQLKLVGNDGGPGLEVDIGKLALGDGDDSTGLKVDLGKLLPDLSLDLGRLIPSLEAVFDPADQGLATESHLVAKAVEFSTAETVASAVDTDAPADNSLPYFVPQPDVSPAVLLPGTKVQGLLGKIKWAVRKLLIAIDGSIQQDPDARGVIDGSLAQDPDGLGSVSGAVAQHKNALGALRGALEQDPLQRGEVILPGAAEEVGFVTGTLQRLPVLNLEGEDAGVTVTWHITDGNGGELTEGRDYVVSLPPDGAEPGGRLNQLAPSILLVPDFVEFQGIDAMPFCQRAISCEVTVTGSLLDGSGSTLNETRTLGPVLVEVPSVQVPTVLALTEHGLSNPLGAPGSVLVAVPESSAVQSHGFLESQLDSVKTAIQSVQAFARLAGFREPLFAGVSRAIELLVDLLDTTHFIKRDIVELREVVIDRAPVVQVPTKTFEDILSALVLVGPPGREISCHVWEGLWYRGGVFRVTLGRLSPAAIIPNLRNPKSLEQPDGGWTDSFATIEHQPTSDEGNPAGTFNDCLSSFRFLPTIGSIEAPVPLKRLRALVTVANVGDELRDLTVEVRDARTEQPLSGAMVVLRNGAEGGRTSTTIERTTDTTGSAIFAAVVLQSYLVTSNIRPGEPEVEFVDPSISVTADGYKAYVTYVEGTSPL